MLRVYCFALLVSSLVINSRAQDVYGDDLQLLIAAYDGDSAAVARLIGKGTDVNVISYEGTTPLMLAAQNGHTSVVSLLIQNKASIDARTPEGSTALMLAIEAGNIVTAEVLIRNGANVDLADATGRSPLMQAIAVDSFYLPDMLIYYGADIDHKDNDDVNALMLACSYNRFEIAFGLLEGGVDINTVDRYGNTPLHYAVNSGNPSLMDLLIINGSEIDKKNISGYTPLSLAVMGNRYDEALLLISYGADVNTEIRSARNPLAIAIRNDNSAMINLLKVNGAEITGLPDFSIFTITTGFAFNSDDSRLNIGFGVTDPVFLWMPSISYGLRPFGAYVVEEKDSSVYYQFRENRHYIRLDLNKGLFIRRFGSGFSTALYAGAGGVLTFGSYRGSSGRPDTRFLFAPQIGVLFEYKSLRFRAGYEYLNLRLVPYDKSWFTVSLDVLLNNRKTNLIPLL